MNHSRAKILVTLGPASSEPSVIQSLVDAGASAFRVNASHSTAAEVASLVRLVRRTLVGSLSPVAVLVDLQGPKLRVGRMAASLSLRTGEVVRVGPLERLPISFNPSEIGVRPGERILFADGRVEGVVVEVEEGFCSVEVVAGGELSSRKGVNLPDTTVSLPALSGEDEGVALAALDEGADWLALSFVQQPEDVSQLRALVSGRAQVLAKIERPVAVERFERIARAADAVMIARGDLGVELPFESVPLIQEELREKAVSLGVPVVCATEMLESMVAASRPTRAEATDVAAAVLARFDAVMLSAETAVGVDPVAAVSAMRRIRDEVEASERFRAAHRHPHEFESAEPRRAAVASAAASLAQNVGAAAIVALTAFGHTAQLLAACRPSVPVLAATPDVSVARRLALLWGLTPFVVDRPAAVELATRRACQQAVASGLLRPGEIVVVCGSRVGPDSDADAIWVQRV